MTVSYCAGKRTTTIGSRCVAVVRAGTAEVMSRAQDRPSSLLDRISVVVFRVLLGTFQQSIERRAGRRQH